MSVIASEFVSFFSNQPRNLLCIIFFHPKKTIKHWIVCLFKYIHSPSHDIMFNIPRIISFLHPFMTSTHLFPPTWFRCLEIVWFLRGSNLGPWRKKTLSFPSFFIASKKGRRPCEEHVCNDLEDGGTIFETQPKLDKKKITVKHLLVVVVVVVGKNSPRSNKYISRWRMPWLINNSRSMHLKTWILN